MTSKHFKQVRFVLKALELKYTDSVELAAIWFRDNRMWRVSQEDALKAFKAWLPTEVAA